jgi:hypothetical protein
MPSIVTRGRKDWDKGIANLLRADGVTEAPACVK